MKIIQLLLVTWFNTKEKCREYGLIEEKKKT